MDQRVRELKTARVLVVGDVILDRYWYGTSDRISPEAPVPVVRVTAFEEKAGGSANVASNVASLGAQAVLAGFVGGDAAGNTLENLCRDAAIETHLLHVADYQTTAKLRVVCQHQQLLRMDFESTATEFDHRGLACFVEHEISNCGALVLSDYAKGCLDDVQSLLRIAAAAGKKVLVDPKGRDFERYRGAYLVTPNLAEFEAVAGHCPDTRRLEERGRAVCKRYAFAALLITRGDQGMSLVRPDEQAIHLEAEARDVFDVTGAGDTVCAVLATSVAAGQDLAEATMLANTAAGLVVAKVGTAVVTSDELDAALSHRKMTRSSLLSEAELCGELLAARRRGEKIVMTNGCFDILHAGHVRYLEQAAALGDRMIVAVNSDASVKRLKGPKRPLNSLERRMAVLAALKSVDWVVAFEEDTPRALIARLQPDVLVKGGDYETTEIAGAEDVLAAGGQVTTLPYQAGLSTSGLIALARDTAEDAT